MDKKLGAVNTIWPVKICFDPLANPSLESTNSKGKQKDFD